MDVRIWQWMMIKTVGDMMKEKLMRTDGSG